MKNTKNQDGSLLPNNDISRYKSAIHPMTISTSTSSSDYKSHLVGEIKHKVLKLDKRFCRICGELCTGRICNKCFNHKTKCKNCEKVIIPKGKKRHLYCSDKCKEEYCFDLIGRKSRNQNLAYHALSEEQKESIRNRTKMWYKTHKNEAREIMRKYIEKMKLNPIKYQAYKKDMKERSKEYWENIKADPIKHMEYKRKANLRNHIRAKRLKYEKQSQK